MQRDKNKLFNNVKQNELGYYELADSCRKVMNDFYENEYYQKDMSLYHKTEYTEDEIIHRNNLYKEKECMFGKLGGVQGTLLDVGCGEGHALEYYSNNGWQVTGIDFSDYGIKAHHPDMIDCLIKGELIEVLQNHDKKYDFINMDNVLEHLPDPVRFLEIIKNVCHEKTIICIRVPNDFSITQMKAYDNHDIDDAFWVTDKTSEHFNYFTLDSLKKLVEASGYMCLGQVADWPIDFNLFNPRTNYNKNKSVGHDGHVARLMAENMLFEQSISKTLALHEAIADLGVGRDISVWLKLR